MKKLILALLIGIVSLALLSCEPTGSGNKECGDHIDKNADGLCDICDEMIKEEASTPDGTTPEPDGTTPEPETEYTLTFMSEGAVIETVKIKNGESFEPPTPSRGSEYILLGWKNSATGEKITGSTFTWSEDTTLTEIWDTVWSEGF